MRDPRTDPAPGDVVSCNGRCRTVLRIEHGWIYYQLTRDGQPPIKQPFRDSIGSWKAWAAEWTVNVLMLGKTT